ncbi:hypothetical protein UNPF46_30890, partial [Bradyrhizobium sp. UNPF46]|uniref:hypothetical protein n=1 Tax=Bradyrhizobium sp. UNPF46 TaxID=1141168 RepID=UPI00116D44DC
LRSATSSCDELGYPDEVVGNQIEQEVGGEGTMRPRDVTLTLESLARLLGLEADDLATKIQGNLRQLVSA